MKKELSYRAIEKSFRSGREQMGVCRFVQYKIHFIMAVDFLIKGFFMGLSVAAPIGPIAILTIRRTLNGGRMQKEVPR